MSDWLWPNGSKRKPHISDDFGWGTDPKTLNKRYHTGDDFTGFSTNCAVAAGRVSFVGVEPDNAGGGIQVWVDHGDGIQSRYKHNDQALVQVGTEVWPGYSLGIQGSTGYVTGKHLHFEIRVNGTPVNPSEFLTARMNTPASTTTTPTTSKDDDMKLTFLKADAPGQLQGYLLTGPGVADILNEDQALAWGEILEVDVTKLKVVGRGSYDQAVASAETFRKGVAAHVTGASFPTKMTIDFPPATGTLS